MSVIKLWAWRILAAVGLFILWPLFTIMEERESWREVWSEAMEAK